MKRRNTPLFAKVIGDEIIIKIGVDALAWAVQCNDEWPEDLYIPDPKEFAKDIVDCLLHEDDDGSNLLYNTMDYAAILSMENGDDSTSEGNVEMGMTVLRDRLKASEANTIDVERYKSKLPHSGPPTDEGAKMRSAYNEDHDILMKRFRLDLSICYGTIGHPKEEELWEMAVDMGQREGHEGILYYYEELCSLMEYYYEKLRPFMN